MEEPVKNHSGQQLYYQRTGGKKANTTTTLAGLNGPGGLKISKLFLHYHNEETKVAWYF